MRGGWGEGETKKQKRYGSGGDGVPIEMVELLRLMGITVDEGELETADGIGRYLERLCVERGGAQGQGQREGEGSEDDYSDYHRGRESEGEGLKHKEKTWSNRITFIYFPCASGGRAVVYVCTYMRVPPIVLLSIRAPVAVEYSGSNILPLLDAGTPSESLGSFEDGSV